MREMKESGISWFPTIPNDWKVGRIKDIIEVLTDYTANGSFGDLAKNVQYLDYEDYARLVRLTDLRENLENFGVYVDEASYQYLSKSKLYGGEILVANVGAYAGYFCEMPKNKGLATLAPNMFLVRTNPKMLQHYLLYIGSSSITWEQLSQKAISSAQPKLNKTDVKTVYIPIPPITEQQLIANFLDSKCTEIDSLTAEIQSQIDALEQYKFSVITETVTKGLDKEEEVKDSKIFYIGPINSKWEISKIGYICTKLSRPFKPEDTALICSNKGKVLVRDENAVGKMVSEDNAMQGIHKDDIAIHGMDTWHGAIAVSEYDGKITRVVHVCDSIVDKRFVVYFMQYLAVQGVYKLISNGVRGNTSDFRSWDKVKDIYIPVPPSLDEQKKICDFLDNICTEVESIINKKKEQLSVLEDYKKELIYEYVTGKKEVPQ